MVGVGHGVGDGGAVGVEGDVEHEGKVGGAEAATGGVAVFAVDEVVHLRAVGLDADRVAGRVAAEVAALDAVFAHLEEAVVFDGVGGEVDLVEVGLGVDVVESGHDVLVDAVDDPLDVVGEAGGVEEALVRAGAGDPARPGGEPNVQRF